MSEYLYGIQNGKPVSIADIPVDMKGLKCDCICPDCGRPFEACSLRGKVNRYFRHYTEKLSDGQGKSGGAGPECDVDWANESGLHRMAKHIVQQERKVAVPALEVPLGKLKLGLPDHIKKGLLPIFVFKEATILDCMEVELEHFIADFKPDAVVRTPDEYLIEIYVRHKVPPEKIKKVANYGSPMLEIDLSSFMEEPISYEDLRKLIIDCFESREWKFHPDSEEAFKRAKEYYLGIPIVQEYIRKREEREKEEQARQIEEERLARAEAEKRERRTNKLTRLLQPENYRKELERLRNDTAFFQRANTTASFDFWFYRKEGKKTPFFIDIPITGEMIFQCDRRIWQGIIFNRYVYGQKEDKAKFNIPAIFKDLKDKKYNIRIDWDLAHRIQLPGSTPYPYKEFLLSREVIDTYIRYLELLGFVLISGYKNQFAIVQARRTIVPPDQISAQRLLSALQKVDRLSPDIDSLLRKELWAYWSAKEGQKQRNLEKAKQAIADAKIAEQNERKAVAEAQEKKRRENHLQVIQKFDFSQSDRYIYDLDGWRLAQCTSCDTIVRASRIFKYVAGNMNQGVCRSCISKKRML